MDQDEVKRITDEIRELSLDRENQAPFLEDRGSGTLSIALDEEALDAAASDSYAGDMAGEIPYDNGAAGATPYDDTRCMPPDDEETEYVEPGPGKTGDMDLKSDGKDGTGHRPEAPEGGGKPVSLSVGPGREGKAAAAAVPLVSHARPSSRREEPIGLLRPRDGLWAAFIVPMVIMVIIFAQRGIFPFGEESFLRTDMYHQYAPFFSEFKHKLSQGGSLLYSWDVGMGVNFAALYAYYLASPLNWLIALCPPGNVIEFMTYSIVFKIGFSGWAFAFYLTRHRSLFGQDGDSAHNFGAAFFGIFYALSGYMAAYSWNIMWLDCILLFPLILLGLERLVKEQRCLLYCVTLGLSILSNYYISIMICIFMVLYFIALLILEGRKKIGHWFLNLFQFGFFSLVAGGLAAVVLLPEIAALEMTASGDFNFPKSWSQYFSIFDMIARHLPNVETEIGLDHWPNIYCGTAALLLLGLYLACRKIPVREKAVYCGLLLLFFASFAINVPNFIWHGFHYPNSLPCRQSFIYIALVLLMCHRAYVNLREIPWKHVVWAFWGSAVFVLLAQKLVTEEHFHFSVYYVAIVYLALYAGLIYLFKAGKAGVTAALLLTLGLVSLEAAINTTLTSVTTVSRTAYIKDNAYVRELLDRLDDPDFYRVEKVERKTKNDGAWLHFPSVSLFSSTANADLTAFYKSLGCESSTNAYSITGSTPLVDMLMSVKYALSGTWDEERPERRMIDQEGDMYLYENTYTLPLGYLVPPEFEYDWKRDMGNPAAAQNDLCDVMGVERALEESFGETAGNTFHFTVQEGGHYYVFVSNGQVEDVTVTIGDWSKSFSNVDRGYLLDLGYQDEGREVSIKGEDPNQQLYANIYRVVPEGLRALHDKLGSHPLALDSHGDTELSGTVTAPEEQILFTSIPYDKGWTVLLDGEERTPRKILDTFLAVDIPKGEHTLEFSYEPEGLRAGAAITGGSLAVVALLGTLTIIIQKKSDYERRGRRRERRAAGRRES